MSGHLRKNAGGHLLKNTAGHLVKCGGGLCCKDTIGINCTISGASASLVYGASTRSGSHPFYVWDLYRVDVYEYGDVNNTWYRDLVMEDSGTKTSSNCYDGFATTSSSGDITDVLLGEVTERHYSNIDDGFVHAEFEPVWTEADATGSYAYYLVEHVADLFLRFGPHKQFRMVSKITASSLTTVGSPVGSAPTGGAGALAIGTESVVLGPVLPGLSTYDAKGFCIAEDDTRLYRHIITTIGETILCEWSPQL